MDLKPEYYLIKVRGQIDIRWADWFNGMDLKHKGQDALLYGKVSDQAKLHGILSKIRDLGLTILLVEHIENHSMRED